MALKDNFGGHICGSMEKGQPKARFKQAALAYLREVLKCLGWEEDHLGFNPGGPAVSGDADLVAFVPGSEFGGYVSIGASCVRLPGASPSGIVLMYRATSRARKWTGYTNCYAAFDTPAAELAEKLRAEVERTARREGGPTVAA